jgi:hypothetical protein
MPGPLFLDGDELAEASGLALNSTLVVNAAVLEQKQDDIIAALGANTSSPTAFSLDVPPAVLTSIYTISPISAVVIRSLLFTGDASAEVQVALDSVVVLYGRISWTDRVFSALMNLEVGAGATLDISVIHREALTQTYKGSINVQP